MRLLRRTLLSAFLILSILNAQQLPFSALEKQIDAAVETFKPAGLTIAIVKDDKVVLNKAYGRVAANSNEKMTTKHLFNIASCSKAFTSTLAAMMVEQGKMKWSDKVIEYFPKFRLADPYIQNNLNLVDILSHRTGLSTFTGDLLWYFTDYNNKQVMERMATLPIQRDFRSQYGYQNNMFMIAGEMMSQKSGLSWNKMLQQMILDPLKMEATRPSNLELKESDPWAKPHIDNKIVVRHDFTATMPAASIFSNVEDMAKWIRFNLNKGIWQGDTLIKNQNLEYLRQIHLARRMRVSNYEKGRNFTGVGLGWKVADFHGKRVIEHNGGMPGYVSKVTLIPELNVGFVVLNNNQDGNVNGAILQHILDYYVLNKTGDHNTRLLERYNKYLKRDKKKKAERLASRISDTQPSAEPNAYTGLYRDKWYGDAKVELKNNNLHLTLMPSQKMFYGTMEHWHYNTYKVTFKDPFLTYALVTFGFKPDGTVSDFKIDLPNWDFHFENLHFKRIVQKN